MDDSYLNTDLTAAYHESGHAVALLHCGRRVNQVVIGNDGYGSGRAYHNHFLDTLPKVFPRTEPGIELCWKIILSALSEELMISLSGPITEAQFLGKKHYSPESQSDFETCKYHQELIKNVWNEFNNHCEMPRFCPNEFYFKIEKDTWIWVNQQNVWVQIQSLANCLHKFKSLNEDLIGFMVGNANRNKYQRFFLF